MDDDLIIEEKLPEDIVGDSFIDATQNVIMNAAENVSEVLETTGKNVATQLPEIPFYEEVEFWIGAAFVLTVCVLFKPAWSFISKALQSRIEKVISDIDNATKLRDDAQNLLADYQRRFINAEKEANEIIERSRLNINNLKNKELEKLKSTMENKENETQRRITAATEKAKNEINISASVASISLAQKAIEYYLDNTDKSKLIDDAIAELDKLSK